MGVEMDEDVTVTVNADTAPFQAALENLQKLAGGFGSQLTNALKGAVVSGRDLDETLRRVGLSLAGMALNQGLKPLESLAGSLVSKLAGGLLPFAQGGVPGRFMPFAEGGVASLPAARIAPFADGGVPGRVVPFAAGGVVSAPTFFPAAGALGLMGEAGPEAIMPLRRGADGKLGVAAGEGGAAPVQVVFQVNATDAASFRKSEAQITGLLARAVSRGARKL